MLVMENPAGRATGGAFECLADTQNHSTSRRASKRFLRVALITGFNFGGGAR